MQYAVLQRGRITMPHRLGAHLLHALVPEPPQLCETWRASERFVSLCSTVLFACNGCGVPWGRRLPESWQQALVPWRSQQMVAGPVASGFSAASTLRAAMMRSVVLSLRLNSFTSLLVFACCWRSRLVQPQVPSECQTLAWCTHVDEEEDVPTQHHPTEPAAVRQGGVVRCFLQIAGSEARTLHAAACHTQTCARLGSAAAEMQMADGMRHTNSAQNDLAGELQETTHD